MHKQLWQGILFIILGIVVVGCGPQAALTGTVQYDGGEVASGAIVQLIGPTEVQAQAGADGTFFIDELRQGSYYAAVHVDGEVVASQPVTIRDEHVATNIIIPDEQEVYTVNLLPPRVATFHEDALGFTATAGTEEAVIDSTRARHGDTSLRVKGNARNHGVWIASTFVPKQRGTYTASVYIYGSAGDQFYMQFQEKGRGGTGVEKNYSGETFTLKGDGWERIYVTATFDPPAGESLGIVIRSATDGDFEVWLDQLQLEENYLPAPWQEPVVTKNLLTYNQATVELDTRGFISAVGSGKAPTLTIDRNEAWQGNSSLRVDGPGEGQREGVWMWSVFVPDERGTYTGSMYLKGTPGDRFMFVFEEKGQAGTGKQTETPSPVFELKTSDWERHEFTVTMREGQTLGFVLRHAEAKPFTVWVDGVQIEEGPVATKWVSPAIPLGY